MRTKTAPVKVKTGEDAGLGDGQFEAMVSVFGNVDSDGDRVLKGAFTDTLEDWTKSGDPMPVIWSHDHQDPDSHIGVVLDAKETDEGLYVKGQLDIDEESDNPRAKRVYKLLKSGRVRNWSYAYDVNDYAPSDDEGVTDLKAIGLHEVGPTLVGSNRDTRTLDVKSEDPVVALNALLDAHPDLIPKVKAALDGEKAGRVLSSKNEQKIRDAVASLESVLATLGEVTQEQASGAATAKTEERGSAKAEEPTPPPSARVLAAQTQLALNGGQ